MSRWWSRGPPSPSETQYGNSERSLCSLFSNLQDCEERLMTSTFTRLLRSSCVGWCRYYWDSCFDSFVVGELFCPARAPLLAKCSHESARTCRLVVIWVLQLRGPPSSCECPRASPSCPPWWSPSRTRRRWRASRPCEGTCGVSDLSCGWTVWDTLHTCKVCLQRAWRGAPGTKFNLSKICEFTIFYIITIYSIFQFLSSTKVVWINQILPVIPASDLTTTRILERNIISKEGF